MSLAAEEIFPTVDVRNHDCISDSEADFFRSNGLLVIRGLLAPAELTAMRDATLPLVERV